jgi:hypothetical protein
MQLDFTHYSGPARRRVVRRAPTEFVQRSRTTTMGTKLPICRYWLKHFSYVQSLSFFRVVIVITNLLTRTNDSRRRYISFSSRFTLLHAVDKLEDSPGPAFYSTFRTAKQTARGTHSSPSHSFTRGKQSWQQRSVVLADS